MTQESQLVECPCYPICSGLGMETGPWCRYNTADLPPPGMRKFDPKDTWCPPGVQATVLMLGHLLAGEGEDPGRLAPILARVRSWAEALRAHPVTSQTTTNGGSS